MTSINITEAILNHLKMNTTGALLLTGDWGSGKTYHIKNKVFPIIESQTSFRPLMVSLYGESDKNLIAQKILFTFLDNKGKKVKLNLGNISKGFKIISDTVPFVKKYFDFDKLLLGVTAENALKLIPTKNLLICFDDLERMSNKISNTDFLGFINDLVENLNCKVLIIANEEEISNGITYKEKTIEKTIYFESDIKNVFDNLISANESLKFKTFLENHKAFFIQSLTASTHNEISNVELKKMLTNIRTLKFSLEHFRICFELLAVEDNINDLLIKQLENLWIFVLSVSIEFRKPNNISLTVRKNLDKQASLISSIDISNFLSASKIDIPAEDNEWSYSEDFKDIYYNRLSQIYIFHEEVYNLITGGKKIDKMQFIINLDERFKIKNGEVNPANEILNTLLSKGYWTYTNEQFVIALNTLLDHCEKGDLEDLVSYANALYFLSNFSDIIQISKNDILNKLKNGLDLYFTRKTLSQFEIKQFAMAERSFNDNHEFSSSLISYIKIKIEEQKNLEHHKEIENINILFQNDLPSFISNFLPLDESFKQPDVPILHNLQKIHIETGLKSATPDSLHNLKRLLFLRYIDTSFAKKIEEEITFLRNIDSIIKQMDFYDETLSKYIIEKELVPTVKKATDILEKFRLDN
jgi:hypothetical protein